MALTRRGLFGLLPALGAIAATGKAEEPTDTVKPIILEHVCDRGASRLTPEEVREAQKEYPWMYRGCGTRFQWHWGTNAYCPNCGYCYLVTLEDLKTNFYKRV